MFTDRSASQQIISISRLRTRRVDNNLISMSRNVHLVLNLILLPNSLSQSCEMGSKRPHHKYIQIQSVHM